MIRGRCCQIAVDGFSSLPAHLEHHLQHGREGEHWWGQTLSGCASTALGRCSLCRAGVYPAGIDTICSGHRGVACAANTGFPGELVGFVRRSLKSHSYQSLSQLVWRLPWRLCRSGDFLPRQNRHILALFQPFVFSSLHLFRNMSPALFWQLHLIKNICMKNVFSSIPELALLCKENLNFPRNCSDTFSNPSLWTCMCEVVMIFPAADVCTVTLL